jgi:hypothetical protein
MQSLDARSNPAHTATRWKNDRKPAFNEIGACPTPGSEPTD